MRSSRTKDKRADLRRVRQDVLLLIEEQEARITTLEIFPKSEEKTPPAMLETIASRLLDAIGGGEFRIMLKGEQTIQQRAAELLEEEQRRLKLRW